MPHINVLGEREKSTRTFEKQKDQETSYLLSIEARLRVKSAVLITVFNYSINIDPVDSTI